MKPAPKPLTDLRPTTTPEHEATAEDEGEGEGYAGGKDCNTFDFDFSITGMLVVPARACEEAARKGEKARGRGRGGEEARRRRVPPRCPARRRRARGGGEARRGGGEGWGWPCLRRNTEAERERWGEVGEGLLLMGNSGEVIHFFKQFLLHTITLEIHAIYQ
jgi:hypothetical protein